MAKWSKNHRRFTNHQVVIDTDTRLVVVVGRPLPGNRDNRDNRKAWADSGAKAMSLALTLGARFTRRRAAACPR